VNVAKTQAIALSTKHNQPPEMTLLGQPLPWLREVKYLGVTIDRRLNMSAHVNNTINRTRTARALLTPVMKSSLPLTAKINIYKGYIRSRLTYAAPAWYALVGECKRRRLRAQQSLALRAASGAHYYVSNHVLHRDLKVEHLDDFITRLARAMFERADGSRLTHLQNIAPHHTRPPDKRALPRDLIRPDPPATT
jgi:hypothetical protein